MKIGILKEIKTHEYRVAMTPTGVRELSDANDIHVESGAGLGVGYADEDYTRAGATIAPTRENIYSRSEIIMKVKEPLAEEYNLIQRGQILFTYLHLAANSALTKALLNSGATCIAYESVRDKGRLPLLEPMSEIAGKMSITVGASYLSKHTGGSGELIGGVPGVPPCRVVILGGGTAGINAARAALGLGADVTILEIDVDRMRWIDLTLGCRTVFSSTANLEAELSTADIIIGAVLIPNARAPRLIRREMLGKMKPGCVFVDIAIDQGGCAESSRPTTHADPVYTVDNVIHYCVANMPGAYPRTATKALTNVTLPYVKAIATLGVEGACKKMPQLQSGINIDGGRLLNAEVASAHSLVLG